MDIPPTQPMPLLILLSPQGGNRYYYFKAGLDVLIRELTASGQIQPMVVFCLANDQTFGGYFYGNSDPAGLYDDIFRYEKRTDGGVPDDLVEVLHWRYPATIEQTSKRGIGGVGQGSYGALRAAIMNPGVFSSISVTDGPLDFDGTDGFSGLISLFGDALAEQDARYYLNPHIDTVITDADTTVDTTVSIELIIDTTIDTLVVPPDTTIDTTVVVVDWSIDTAVIVTDMDLNIVPFDLNRDFDSSRTMPISQMLIGGAYAFSPDDTVIDYTRTTNNNRIQLSGVTRFKIADSNQVGGGDSTTFIGNIVRRGSQSRFIDMDFHLPFYPDAGGVAITYDPIWTRWMANNLEDLHEADGSNPLTGVNLWFGTNPGAKWQYYEMTQSFISYLQTPAFAYDIEVYEYSSYNADPVIEDEYLFDILREMLIFHSNSFGE
jgi:hypothetical protein